ncbi:phosphoribosylanthranilate isomerase [Priestia filamentosa]|uniref:N-(5'-phosphoribosyl)anthranilate isomerase n=1 Tax=Priestia filamentosa TaxID=1402861 RepID=A0A1X7D3H9_9BACI|nr:phosphoribosylanthranilate isomerase [Priestia filamentosa]AKO93960.1 hypothetical protein BEH_18830 [Priestia filamentosa]MDT3764205.1 phosphoribosylanthranilate isomerase [Priestia filamentosa]OXS71325.1 hypothetical protein B1B01_03150 [Priestia filamentosa]WRU94590.1 phosphoribosylanthranilate isomerase [Priestia filamentosa]SMF08137.1 phosphoribosylanthranilate isomerase [Priestia filamentosa]
MKIKYCGVKNDREWKLVTESMCDYVGFIFTSKSKRYVSPEDVEKWAVSSKKRVGVFVNEQLSIIEKVVKKAKLDVVQCHGEETKEDLFRIKEATGKEIWKALPHDRDTEENMILYSEAVDGFVIDAKVKGSFGGTGTTFDWSAIPKYTNKAEDLQKLCFIAGGIRPGNIEDLLTYSPQAVDISSGIEENGKKTKTLMRELERKMQNEI